jgi:hypothetical protein
MACSRARPGWLHPVVERLRRARPPRAERHPRPLAPVWPEIEEARSWLRLVHPRSFQGKDVS